MAQLQVLLWLGPEEESSHWMDELLKNDRTVKDKVAYVAETVSTHGHHHDVDSGLK